MKIYIGADHRGFSLKAKLKEDLIKLGYEVNDDGDKRLDPDDDYPIFAQRVVNDVLSSDDNDARGILMCGSGQGMMMVANRFRGIRAVVGYDNESARASRTDEDSNILCLPSSVFDDKTALSIIHIWLDTEFSKAPRYIRRLREMDNLN
ncbi:MAG TPA: RpiB/LacA/LacB family sugar-phosphate isomerase [Candidatus Saccharimonadia bacterium]|nr:RpiB/LacA/LacB family sugar-phosphate isomerase [Candidatus Saccharimonadia bacterium]